MSHQEIRESEQKLNLRQRAIARADNLLALKVDASVTKALQELEISGERIEKAAEIYDELVGDYPATIGKALSKREREELDLQGKPALVYGEIHFKTFALAFEKIRQKYGGLQENSGGIFVDLGSGTGKAVFGAILMHQFQKAIGIEILGGLHNISLEIFEVMHNLRRRNNLSDSDTKYDNSLLNGTKNTIVQFIKGDLLEVDWWTSTDVAFANSTCFTEELMLAISKKAELMKPGSFFITFTRRITSKKWQLLEYERHIMSWGEATVFIQQRKDDDVIDGDNDEKEVDEVESFLNARLNSIKRGDKTGIAQ